MTRQEEFLQIKRLFAVWIAEIEINSAFSYTDINRIAEGFCKMLLNKLYSYELEDLNKIQKNYPGLDLGDLNQSKVAFQITSRTDRQKIYDGLEQVVSKKLDETFTSGIKFLILNNNDISFTQKTRDPSEILGSFRYERDILYPHNLIERIEEIYDEDDDLILFMQVKSLLEKEFGRKPQHADNNAFPLDLVTQLAKFLKKGQTGLDEVIQWTSGSAYIDLGLPQHKILSDRTDLVNSYESTIKKNKLLWLEGNHSTGKSTIAILIGRRQKNVLWIDCRDISEDFLVSHILQSFCAYFQIETNNQSSAVIIKTIVNHFKKDSFIVFNDLPHLSNRVPRLSLYWMLLEEMAAGGHKLMITTNFSPPSLIDDRIEYQKENIPPLDEYDTKEILGSLGASDAFIDAYCNLICSASDGHPIILRAIAKHLKERNWPTDNLELIFRPTNIISKAEIYASITQSISSEYSKALLFRLKSIIGNFDQSLINCVAQVAPEIPKPGESFNDLNGIWAQEISPGVYQLSPLIRHLDDNLTLEVKQGVMFSLASQVLAKGTISPLEGSKAIFYFQMGGYYDEAAKILLQILISCIGNADRFFDWGLSVHWLTTQLPIQMSLDSRIRIRCLQISLCQEKKEYLNFLIKDLQFLMLNASIVPELELIVHSCLLLATISTDPLLAMQHFLVIDSIIEKVEEEELINVFVPELQNIIWIGFSNCYTETDFRRWFSLLKENPVSVEILDPVNNLSYILSGHIFYNNIISTAIESDEVTKLLQLILEKANEAGITLLAAYALKAIIYHESKISEKLELVNIYYSRFIPLFEDRSIEHFIIDLELATQNYLKDQDQRALELLNTLDVNIMPINYRERLDYFLLNVKLYRDIDPKHVLANAQNAVGAFNNVEIFARIEYIKAIGELSLAQVYAGQNYEAFKTISDGYAVLLEEFKMEPEFQGQIIRYGHVILYLTEIIETGIAFSFGEGKANAIPKSGFFHLTNELLLEAGHYSSEKNFAGAVLIQRLYEHFGDEDNSRKWAYTALEVGLDCNLASFASILLKMVFYLITQDQYTKAYNIIAYIQKQYTDLKDANEHSFSESDGRMIATNVILNHRLYLSDSMIYFGVLFPAMLKLTLDILKAPMNNEELEQRLSLIFSSGQLIINDKKQFEDAKRAFTQILLDEISPSEFMDSYNQLQGQDKDWIYTISAFLWIVHGSSTVAANAQLAVILKMIPFYEETFVGFYRFVIVPYLSEIWQLKIANSPKDFSDYKFLATKGIDAISKKNWDLKIPFIYNVLSNHLNLRMTDESEKLIFK